MRNCLSTLQKISIGISSFVFAILALLFCLSLKVAPNYSDFIVGNITWQANGKIQDLIVVPVIIFVFSVVFLLLSASLKKQKQLYGNIHAEKITEKLIFWSIPAAAAISSLFLGAVLDQGLIILSSIGIASIVLSYVSYNSRKTKISSDAVSMCIFGILLLGLIPVELALISSRGHFVDVDLEKLKNYESVAYLILGSGITSFLLLVNFFPKYINAILPKLYLVGQIGLSLLFICLYPAHFLQNGEINSSYSTSWMLKLLIFGMIAWAVFDVVNRNLKFNNEIPVKLVSPIAIFALLVALRSGMTIAPNINPDDYHFGEMVLGWWSYLNGKIPYVDYFPSHGIAIDDFSAFLSYIFYDGTVGTIGEAARLGYAVLAFISFLSLFRFSKNIGFAFVSTYFLGESFVWLFFTPFICLWFNHELRKNAAKWLSVWLITVPILILGVPGQGLLLVAASGVMVIYFIWKLYVRPIERKYKGILFSIFLLIVLGLFTPMYFMLFGALRYVLENGSINQVAYGIPWVLSWGSGNKAGLLFEIIRMSWIYIPILGVIIIYSVLTNVRRKRYVITPLLLISIFLLLLIPYSMGRIDTGSVSRSGLAAIFGWTILFPLATWFFFSRSSRVILILSVACIGSALNSVPLVIGNFSSLALNKVNTEIWKDGPKAGLPNIGHAVLQEEHWTRLVKLNAILNKNIKSNESYLDLTSRNAQYFYLNRKPTMSITAPYNLVSSSQQKREVDHLMNNMPNLVLLDADNIIHDGGGLALRNPFLYKFILDNYDPRIEDGYIFGFRKSNKIISEVSATQVEIKNFTDINWNRGVSRLENAIILNDASQISLFIVGGKVHSHLGSVRKIVRVWKEGAAVWLDGPRLSEEDTQQPLQIKSAEYKAALFDKSFSQSDFRKIPISWGSSINTLNSKMVLVHDLNGVVPVLEQLSGDNLNYKITGPAPKLTYDLRSFNVSGRDAGMLKFNFSCDVDGIYPKFKVYWWGNDASKYFEASGITFTGGTGVLLVPLEATPYWLLSDKIKGMRIEIIDPMVCKKITINKISLLKRN